MALLLPTEIDVRTSGDEAAAVHLVGRTVPVCDGFTARTLGPMLGLHVSPPAWVRHVREGTRSDTVFEPGNLTLIPGGCETTCFTRATTSFVHVNFGPDLVARAFERHDLELPNLVRFDDPLCRELVSSMADEARRAGDAAKLYLEHAAFVLLVRLAGRVVPPSSGTMARGLGSRDLQRIVSMLHERMAHNPGLAELAAAVDMSPRHLARLFKRSTGQSIHGYYDRIRIEESKLLLTTSDLEVTEVAARVGYANPSHFAARFRRATGVSPTTFRSRSRS